MVTTPAVAYTGEEIAAALDAVISGKTGVELNAVTEQHGHVDASTSETKTFTIRQNGYVLINSTLGNKAVLDSFQSKTVNKKNEYPTVTKTQSKTGADNSYASDDISSEIGKTVYYRVNIEVPKSADKAIEETSGTTTTHYPAILTLTYTATVNEDAVMQSPWNTNESYLKYDDYSVKSPTPRHACMPVVERLIDTPHMKRGVVRKHHGNAECGSTVGAAEQRNRAESLLTPKSYDNYTSVHSKVTTRVFKFDLEKRIENVTGDLLPGVKFTLTRTDNSGDSAQTLYYTVPSEGSINNEVRFTALGAGEKVDSRKVTTNKQGKISFEELEQGTYTLTETDTVSGYRGLASPIQITVDADGNISSTSLSGAGSQIGTIATEGDNANKLIIPAV